MLLKESVNALLVFSVREITFLAPALMCAMSSTTLVVAICPKAIEWGFYVFYDLKILLSGSLWRI